MTSAFTETVPSSRRANARTSTESSYAVRRGTGPRSNRVTSAERPLLATIVHDRVRREAVHLPVDVPRVDRGVVAVDHRGKPIVHRLALLRGVPMRRLRGPVGFASRTLARTMNAGVARSRGVRRVSRLSYVVSHASAMAAAPAVRSWLAHGGPGATHQYLEPLAALADSGRSRDLLRSDRMRSFRSSARSCVLLDSNVRRRTRRAARATRSYGNSSARPVVGWYARDGVRASETGVVCARSSSPIRLRV